MGIHFEAMGGVPEIAIQSGWTCRPCTVPIGI